MARLNVYLPDELAEQARAAGLNISVIARDAVRRVLASTDTDAWLDRLELLPHNEVSHERVIAALDEAQDEFGA